MENLVAMDVTWQTTYQQLGEVIHEFTIEEVSILQQMFLEFVIDVLWSQQWPQKS